MERSLPLYVEVHPPSPDKQMHGVFGPSFPSPPQSRQPVALILPLGISQHLHPYCRHTRTTSVAMLVILCLDCQPRLAPFAPSRCCTLLCHKQTQSGTSPPGVVQPAGRGPWYPPQPSLWPAPGAGLGRPWPEGQMPPTSFTCATNEGCFLHFSVSNVR